MSYLNFQTKEQYKKYLYRQKKGNAKSKRIVFSLKWEDFQLPDKCPVFKTPFEFGHPQFAASVDRIDNSKGYEPGNVQVVSRLANTMKNAATPEQLKQFANWILETTD